MRVGNVLRERAAKRMANSNDVPGASLPFGNLDDFTNVIAGLIVIIVDRSASVEPMKVGDPIIQ